MMEGSEQSVNEICKNSSNNDHYAYVGFLCIKTENFTQLTFTSNLRVCWECCDMQLHYCWQVVVYGDVDEVFSRQENVVLMSNHQCTGGYQLMS